MKKLLIFILLLLPFGINAQRFVMIPLPNQKELPQSELYHIFEDSEGYMWYATREAGLCRDNGYQVDVFRNDRDNPSLMRSNSVRCIAENRIENEIWIGTKQGAYILSKRDYSIRIIHGISNYVNGIVQTSDGSMWVAANRQILVYNSKAELKDSFSITWKGKPLGVETMTLDSHETLWLMQWDGGIHSIDTKRGTLTTHNWYLPVGPTSIAEDTLHHRYYVGTWGEGVFLYDGTTTQPLSHGLLSPMQKQVRSVHYDGRRNMLWVVTMSGLYAYEIVEGGQLNPVDINVPGMSSQQAIFPISFDHNGNIWVPGSSPLSFILLETMGHWMERFSFDDLSQKVGVKVPVGVFENEGDYCWLWSDRTQLLLYNLKTGQYTYVNGPIDAGITRFGDIIARSHDGSLWCSSGHRVYRCEHDDMKVSLAKDVEISVEGNVTSLHEGRDGTLYIGADHLYKYVRSTNTLSLVAKDVRVVRDIITRCSDGKVFFISSNQGLCEVNDDNTFKSLFPYNKYTSLACGADGKLWLANAFGDVWQVGSTLEYKPVASSRESNGVKDMVVDSLGHLWVMGDTYVIEYHPEVDRRRIFYSSDNFINLDNFGGMSLCPNGKVAVAGGGGIVMLNPLSLNTKLSTKAPAVASYIIDGKKYLLSSSTKEIKIPSNVVMLELQLTNFSFIRNERQRFAYRIDRLSDQWVELEDGSNNLQLLNLRKGNYTLEVKCCDFYGQWGEPVTVLNIKRLPAWYETWIAYICYFIIAVLIVALSIKEYLKRSSEKTRQQMDEQLTEMKLRFFTNVSHELRTPLSLIITPLESMLEKDAPDVVKEKLKLILRNANILLSLVNRLLDFRKLDIGEMKINPTSADIYSFLRTCADTFIPIADNRRLKIKVNIPEGSCYVLFDNSAMQHIVYNLLSNSLKYTEQGGVELSASYSADGYLTLVVSDSGVGIAAEELPYVFDRYYQASNAVDNSVAGTGIGLNMVKELVELMNGKIDVESTVGVGTSFTVRLPLVSADDKEEELLPESPVIPKLPSLLLVDDNDDMRDFLVHELKDDYNILQARNGREALRIAQTHYVDVVLSDVMMPQMDGNELCRRLKEDESTSHIFVILITAKTAEESMLHSYESGADFYLTKPFSMALLRNRLSHLANMQEQRIMMLSKVEDVKDSDSAEDELRISPVDRKFMTSIKQTMDQYVADSSFSVDVFCNELGMSRMNFYRKMRALTGKTPAQYINEYRLALADKLLHEGELNVSEVADRTGFTTPSYFSKCYKAKYGVVPKDVRS